MSNVADQELGEYPNQWLGVEPLTSTNAGQAVNQFNAPIKLDSANQLASSQLGTGAMLQSGSGTPVGLIGSPAGGWWLRTDTPATVGQRLYICTVAGAAGSATWVALNV